MARRHDMDERQRSLRRNDQSKHESLDTVVHEISLSCLETFECVEVVAGRKAQRYYQRCNWACPRCEALCFGRDAYRQVLASPEAPVVYVRLHHSLSIGFLSLGQAFLCVRLTTR